MKNKGGTLMIIIIIIAVLFFFKVDLRSVTESEIYKNNLEFAESKVEVIWEQYLQTPILHIRNKLFSDSIGKSIREVDFQNYSLPEIN